MYRYQSLSTKLSVTTSIVATMLIIGIAIYAFMLKSNEVIESEIRDIDLSLSNTSMSIDKTLGRIESAMTSNIWLIDKDINLGDRDSVGEVLEQILALREEIVSAGVIFDIDTGATETTKPYMIYASGDSSASRRTLPAMAHDPRNLSYSWLRTPLKNGRSGWSGPHADLANGLDEVCTYIIPINDRTGSMNVGAAPKTRNALFFADLPISVINAEISSEMPTYATEAFLLDSDGRIITAISKAGKSHTEGHGTATLSAEDALQAINAVSDSIYEGRHGAFDLLSAGKKIATYYNVVNPSGWTLYYKVGYDTLSSALFASSKVLILIFVVSLLCLYIVLSAVIKRMTRPLRQFSDSALEISKGNFTATLPTVTTHDEMARLHNSFDTMQKFLVQYTEQLEDTTRRQALIMSELQIASRIQDDLLPKTYPPFPGRDDINVHAILIPAKEIGGDLYNYFIRDDKLYFIIGDVSGKSVPAAMVMAIACTVFDTIATLTDDPVQMMRQLNATTCGNNEHSAFFITAVIGVLDLRDGTLSLCNAGHDPSLLIDAQGTAHTLRLPANLPAGVTDGYDYKGSEVSIKAGERLLLYTDGITEAEDGRGGFYGIDRLSKTVEAHAGIALASQVGEVVESVRKFSAGVEQTDDITLMVISYTPSDRKVPEPLTIDNKDEEMPRALQWAETVSHSLSLSSSEAYKLTLMVEETVTNINHHSKSKSQAQNITLYASVHDGVLTLIISDNGKGFDPCAAPEVDTSAPLQDRPIGGLGIALLRQIADKMQYRREYGRNYLTLKMNIGRQQPQNET